MYQTSIISNRLVSLGTRSYRQRLETLSGMELTNQKLGRLNKDLDDLYELIYKRINTISEEEVKNLLPLLHELLKSVKALHTTGRGSASALISDGINRLGMNYSAFQELYDDLSNYRIPSDEDPELRFLLTQASTAMQHIS